MNSSWCPVLIRTVREAAVSNWLSLCSVYNHHLQKVAYSGFKKWRPIVTSPFVCLHETSNAIQTQSSSSSTTCCDARAQPDQLTPVSLSGARRASEGVSTPELLSLKTPTNTNNTSQKNTHTAISSCLSFIPQTPLLSLCSLAAPLSFCLS